MSENRVLPVVLAAFCTVLVSFFVFSFIDSNASGGTNPVNEQENQSKENNSEGNSNSQDSSGNSDISNNVQNNVNGNKANITNDVENNVTGENADVSNSIDNNLNNSNDNQIENNVTNNVEVNVNVNVSNNISNNAEAPKSSSGKGNNQGNNNGDNNNGNNEEANNEGEERIIWGVDSASLTTEDMLACVEDNFGFPDIWGRYLGDKEGVSRGLTSDEIELLQSNDIRILVIWNHFDNATGYNNGQSEAKEAIQMAQDLGIPEGVAIFADIEPSYPVDSEFIRGWFETMNDSQYTPGFYGVFDPERDLYAAYEKAGADNAELLESAYVWTAAPNAGITTEDNAPEYQPQAPENAQIGGWQYGLDAQACNIDTNLFDSDLLDVLW